VATVSIVGRRIDDRQIGKAVIAGHYFGLRLDYVALAVNKVIEGNSKRPS
jgi:hypothetical protein